MDELACPTQYFEPNNLPRSEFIMTLLGEFIEVDVVVKLLSLSLSIVSSILVGIIPLSHSSASYLRTAISNYGVSLVFNDEYDTPSHTKKVFANMRRKGKDFSGRVTDYANTTSSRSRTQKQRKTKRKATKISQSSGPTTVVADETVYEERRDIVEKAATTTTSLDTAQDLEITHLKKKVKRLEKKRKLRTSQLKMMLFKVRIESSTRKSLGDQEDAFHQGRNDQDKDGDLITSQTLIKIRSQKSKEKSKERGPKENSSKTATRPTRGVIMREASETTTRPTVLPQQKLNPKDKEVAQRLQAQLQAELEEEERMARQKEEDANIAEWDDEKHFARLRAEEKRRKPPIKAQKMNQMCIYLKNMVGFTNNQLKNKIFEEVQKDFDKTMSWINSFVPMYKEVVEGNGKKAESSGKEAFSKKRASLSSHGTRSEEMIGYILLVKIKLLIRKLEDSKGEHQVLGRIVRIKRLLSADEVIAASYEVTTADYGFYCCKIYSSGINMCPVTILNTKDHLGKFDGKPDEGFFVGYSLNSKAFRVFNNRTRIVEENLHISINGVIDVGANTFNELRFDPEMPALEDISTFNFLSNHEDDDEMANMNNLDTTIQVSPIPTIRIHKDHHIDQVIGDLHSTS
uniref:Retrovirus-related Pol polyprotein from transposon TNT 1-94 n=1 Tax=Tanacetum cinerariifolium TaxID=118510 RepID=A0A699HQ58_TANCI|nr:retrovirus-related Pol polyprotein from transposon TNT 1-94 [Tanacetum cinerariifolium]